MHKIKDLESFENCKKQAVCFVVACVLENLLFLFILFLFEGYMQMCSEITPGVLGRHLICHGTMG